MKKRVHKFNLKFLWNAFVTIIKLESGDSIWRKISFSSSFLSDHSDLLKKCRFYLNQSSEDLNKTQFFLWHCGNVCSVTDLFFRVEWSNPTATGFVFVRHTKSSHYTPTPYNYFQCAFIWNIIFYIETCEPATTLKNHYELNNSVHWICS